MIRVLKKYESQASQTGALALATVFFLLEMFRRCDIPRAIVITGTQYTSLQRRRRRYSKVRGKWLLLSLSLWIMKIRNLSFVVAILCYNEKVLSFVHISSTKSR